MEGNLKTIHDELLGNKEYKDFYDTGVQGLNTLQLIEGACNKAGVPLAEYIAAIHKDSSEGMNKSGAAIDGILSQGQMKAEELCNKRSQEKLNNRGKDDSITLLERKLSEANSKYDTEHPLYEQLKKDHSELKNAYFAVVAGKIRDEKEAAERAQKAKTLVEKIKELAE